MSTSASHDMPVQTVAERIVASLKRHQITHFFGQSLPSALVLACEEQGIKQISYRQENMGGAMADAYARLSGRIGMVVGQNGPAATLLVPPMAEAMTTGTPMIAFVQEVEIPTRDRNAFQELNHEALFHGVTKLVKRLDDPARVEDYVDMAIVAATSGRPGPVVLLLPADILRGPGKPAPYPRASSLGHYPLARFRPTDEALATAAEMIAQARFPVVIAGGGVHYSGAAEALTALMDTAYLPVFTTNMGKGAVAETHPLAGGVQGAINGPTSLARQTQPFLDEADVVLLIGTRTNQNGTDNWKIFNRNASFIHIDIDPMEIGRTYEALRLQGDAKATLEALTQLLTACDLSRRSALRPSVEQRIAAAWEAFEAAREQLRFSADSPIRPERVLNEIQALLSPRVIVATDASYSSMWVAGQLRSSYAGQRYVLPRGLAGLGWGLPFGIGAAVARPEATVIALVGDGGFAHSWAEMETAVRHQIPIVIIVLNNGILGFQKHAETVKFGKWTSSIFFSDVNHAAIAESVGMAARRISDPKEILPQLQEAINAGKPVLLEIITETDAHPPLSLFAGSLDS